MNTPKIGWIGLGTMGGPMSEQLIRAGYPVTVYNRTKDKEQVLKNIGADTAPTPAALVTETDVIVIMVTDDTAVRQIFENRQGIFDANLTGKIIINMSTVSPAINKELARLCKTKGADYLDAPVSGSVVQAQSAQLVIIVGGDKAIFEYVKPIFEKIGKLALLVGNIGAGNAAKLAVNTLLSIYAQGLAESIVFANKNNISTDHLLTIIGNSALGNTFTKIKGEAISSDNFKPAFSLKNIVKDLNLAKQEGLNGPLGLATLNTYAKAEPSLGHEDLIAIIKYLI